MSWRTKEDVLKDLAKAAGPIRNDDLDENLVVGNAPPPLRREDASEEMRLLFGEAHTQTNEDEYWPEGRGPDCEGITAMLRMVEAYENQNDEDFNNGSGDCVITISKVSTHLNPYVAEFKPQGLISPNSRELDSKNIHSDVVTQNVEVTEESKKETVSEVIGKESGDDNEIKLGLNVEKNEHVDEATSLKNQISDAAKSDLFEFKKQKNVAIATLLKLYAKNNPLPPKVTAPVKLIKPAYFEGKPESDSDINTEIPIITMPTEACKPQSRDSSTTSPARLVKSPTNPTSTPKSNIDPEIKQSIDKVSRWLEQPASPSKVKSPIKVKAPTICLGPITFKRKEKSTVDSTRSSPKFEKPSDQTPQYQPTQYAAELAQKYQERKKLTEAKKKEVNWLNLEEVLKAKDFEIKNRLAQQEQQEQEQTATSSDNK